MDTSDDESAAAFRRRLLGSAISTYAVCLLVIPLKFWCRFGGTSGGAATRLGWDDALSFLALIFASVFFFVGIVGMFLLDHHLTSSMRLRIADGGILFSLRLQPWDRKSESMSVLLSRSRSSPYSSNTCSRSRCSISSAFLAINLCSSPFTGGSSPSEHGCLFWH